MTPCVSPLCGWQCATCPLCMWACARAVLWRHMPKLVLRNFTNSRATSKSYYGGFWTPNRLKFFCVTPCDSPLRGGQCATCPTCMWARARAVLWRHVPKLALRNFTNSRATSKSNYYGSRSPNQFSTCIRVCTFFHKVNPNPALVEEVRFFNMCPKK